MTQATETKAADIKALEAQHVLQVYRRNPVVLVEGRGVRVRDVDGREYLDLLSGIGVASLGHGHAGLAAAIAEQANTLLHTSNLFFHPLQGLLAERLASLSGLPRAFFCNSGTEAMEACLKFARRYWHTQKIANRTGFVALQHSFHGRTIGSLSVTWDEHYRTPFAPLLEGVTFVAPDNPAALLAAVGESTAAIVVEPIQGEGGVRPLTPAFAQAVNEACARTGALLIADEVQSGMGRTGHVFYHSVIGLKPDLMALGKALGAGVPVGAALMNERVAGNLSPGDHGSTYGGNLLACRAALFFLDQLVSGGLLAHVDRLGTICGRRLREMAAKHPSIVEVRGAGLMWGIDLNVEAAPIVEAALKHGVLVNRTDNTVVRLLPPLTISEAELNEGLTVLDDVFAEVEAAAA